MKRRTIATCLVLSSVMLVATAATAIASRQSKRDAPPASRLRIEVTGGDKSEPVNMASVYVRFTMKDPSGEQKDAKFELDLKTNPEGVATLPSVPRGKVIIQVVAEGWRPFGQQYDITDDEQIVKIHLEKPPKWY
jgi:hypothetical protein